MFVFSSVVSYFHFLIWYDCKARSVKWNIIGLLGLHVPFILSQAIYIGQQ